MNVDLNYAYNITYYSNEIFSNFFFLFDIYFALLISLTSSSIYFTNTSHTLNLENKSLNNCSFLLEIYDYCFFSDIFLFFL